MFTGTQTHSESELDQWVEHNGGQNNAATWLDWTYFHAELPSQAALPYLEMEVDRFQNLTLDSQRFERERQVVLAERREQVEGEPEAFLSEKLWQGTLSSRGYGRPTIGYMNDIQNIKKADCLSVLSFGVYD